MAAADLQKARSLVARAASLDGGAAESQLAQAQAGHVYDWDLRRRGVEFKDSLRLIRVTPGPGSPMPNT